MFLFNLGAFGTHLWDFWFIGVYLDLFRSLKSKKKKKKKSNKFLVQVGFEPGLSE
jgi:hypothetical protein